MPTWPTPEFKPGDRQYEDAITYRHVDLIPHLHMESSRFMVITTINQLIDRVNALALKEALK